MARDGRLYEISRDEFQKTKPAGALVPGIRHPVSGPYRTVSMGFARPFPETKRGTAYILLAVEHHKGYPSAVATKDQTCATAIDILEECIVVFCGSAERCD